MKKILLFKVFFLSLFMAYGQVSKTNTISGTVTNVPAGGAHIDRTFSFGAAEFTACTGLSEVEISINLILGNGAPPNPGGYGVHEDLNLRLVSPTGTTIDLVQDRWGYWTGNSSQSHSFNGFSAVNGTVHFDDDHPAGIASLNDWPASGNHSPHNPLSGFDGESPVGTWTLRISDGNGQFAAADYVHFISATLSVTCGTSCTEADVPTVTATPNPVCAGSSTTLNIAGNLNDATQWHIYTGFCGVTQVGTTSGSTFTVSPSSNTSYYIRGEGGCVTPGTCGAVTVNVTATEDASFSYAPTTYCADDGDPTPTISGVGGGTFVATPAGLSINASNGQIDVSASTPGTYTVEYTTPGTCQGTADQSITINALDDASFNYSAASYCANDTDPTPTITGLGGGTFSSTAGLSINAGSGAIDVSASTPGTYTVTYTTTGPCPNGSNVTVTVNAADNAAFNYSAASYCVNDVDPTPSITGLPGGTFSSTAGLSINAGTGVIDVSTSTPGTYTVTYTTAGTCPNSSNTTVTVNTLDDASFNYSAASYCANDTDPTPSITGLGGGTFSSTAGLSINASTGAIDVSASTPGTYTVTYTTTGSCPNSSNSTVTINVADNASFNYGAGAYCANDTDPTPTITGLPGGTFISGPGLSINAATGTIDLSASSPGAYTVTYNTAGTCPNSASVSVTVNALDNASFFYNGFAHCVNGTDPVPNITGLPGGTFSSTAGLSINASTGVVDLSASTPATYVITYTTAGACPNSSSVSMAVNPLDDASFSYSAATYCTTDTDPTPTITGTTFGSFSSGAGLSINAGDGTIDVSASTPGTYTVTYTTAAGCPNTSSVSVTINTGDDASFSYGAATYCVSDTDPTPTIAGLPGGTFSSTAGLTINASTGAIDVSTSTPGTYTVTYTTNGTCPNSSSVTVTINALDDASFNYSAAAYCANDTDPTPSITGLGGGTFSSTAGLTINASTGAIDVSTSTPGTYTVTYTTTGVCPNSSTVTVTVNTLDDASFNYSAASYCSADTDPTPTTSGLAGGTFSSGAGLSINASTGVIDLSASTAGTYTVTYTTAGACPNSSSVAVSVTALDDASFNYSAASYCSNATDPTATITGVAGGTFSSTAGLVFVSTATGEIDLSASTLGTYTVTYTTTGSCANSSTQSVTINAIPTAPVPVTPISVCPGDDVILTATGSGTGNINFYDNLMTLAGSVPMPPATATLNVGTLSNGMYTGFVTEENGGCESATAAYSFMVGDTTDPTAVCQDVTIYLDGAGAASIVAGDIDGGSSDNCGAVSLSASQTTFDCSDVGGSPAGTLIITGAYDAGLTGGTPKGVELYASNDIADLSQYGIGSANNGGGTDGEEFTFPAVSVAAGTYIYVASESTQFTNFFGFAPDYTDGSMGINGDDAVELFHMGGVIDVFGDINTDGSGQPWDFLDGWAYRNSGTGPDGSTFALGSWSFSGINVYDNQTTNATTPTPMPIGTFTPASSGSTSVTLTATDGSGNTATCTANVTVLDTVAPTASCQDITVFLDGSGNASVTAADIDNGSSDNCSTVTLSATPTSFTCANVGANTVTLTVTDDSGNTSTCTSTVTVSDTVSPLAVCQNITVYLDAAGTATVVGADLDGGSSDNCGVASFTAIPGVFTCADLGTNSVVLEVADASGNTSTCTSTVTLLDTISPVVTCPGDITEVASAACDFSLLDYTAMASGTDACGTVTLTQSPAAGTLITANTVVTITGDDGNGNTSTCTFNVILDVSGCAGLECSNAIIVDPLDPCGDVEVLSGSTVGGTPNTESFFCGTSLGSGGANWYTFTGDGGDWTASTVSGATNYDTKIWVYEGVCAALNCVTGNDDFSGVQSQVSFATTAGATYYVVVGGFSSNQGNYELTLSNVETVDPTIVCPADQSEQVSATCDLILPDYTAQVTAADNCGVPTITQSPAPGTLLTADQVVTMTATDAAGNSATCTFNVLLTGATPPVAVCQDVTVYLDAAGNASIVAADIDGGSSATCGTPSLSASNTAFTCADLGTNSVTLTVTDGGGNTDDCVAVVTVLDTLAPTPDAATLADVTAECEVTTLVDPLALDNCGTVVVTNDATLPISTQGTSIVTWTYDDGNGNTSTQTQNIVINDVSSPLPTTAPLPDLTGECSVDVMPTAPIAIDACTGSITGVEITGTTFPVTTQGVTVLVWEFDDGNGNITTQSQNIVVNDVSAPVPDVATLADVTGDCSIDQPTAPTATDNCSGVITATTPTVFPITAIGTTVIVWEYLDANGNISTQTQNAINTGVDASTSVSADGGTITANTGGGTYEWINCDFNSTVAGETGQSFTPPTNGNYAVVVTVGNCSDTSACVNVSTAGIDVLSSDLLLVYPNPSLDGYFTISYDGTIEAIDVVDMLGRVIELPTDLSTGNVNGSELAQGRYMIRVRTEQSVVTTEIVIAR